MKIISKNHNHELVDMLVGHLYDKSLISIP